MDYAIWLNRVLSSRGVPAAHLSESFALLAEFFSQHLPLVDAARVGGVLAAAREFLAHNEQPTLHSPARVPALAGVSLYIHEVLSGNRRAAEDLMNGAMQSGYTLSQAAVRLVQPAMYEIGGLWQENRITVAQEHLATAISQDAMAHGYLQADFAPPVGRKAMFAAVAGNHHSLGLRMLSDAFETIGWDALYLGADVPTRDLIKQVETSQLDLLCLSLSLPVHLKAARETVENLKAELGNRCPTIWVGGQATMMGDRVWHTVRADGWAADALHALEQVGS
jgi:methanogenic corrinoid protein MtbC1